MNIVIQCAAKKFANAGRMKTGNGKSIMFVADPALLRTQNKCLYQTPDTIADDGLSWRLKLLQYNQGNGNPFNLYPAYKLYVNSTYRELVSKYGINSVFILSAGWGFINASFLTPYYDITFSASVEKYKRRMRSDKYNDFCFLPEDTDDHLVFFGGKDYLPLFNKLTEYYQGKRYVFYNSKIRPPLEGCELIRFDTRTRTNWHYECAKAFMNGDIDV